MMKKTEYLGICVFSEGLIYLRQNGKYYEINMKESLLR